MKKIFYILLLVAVSALTFNACTKEEVKPKIDGGSGYAIVE